MTLKSQHLAAPLLWFPSATASKIPLPRSAGAGLGRDYSLLYCLSVLGLSEFEAGGDSSRPRGVFLDVVDLLSIKFFFLRPQALREIMRHLVTDKYKYARQHCC